MNRLNGIKRLFLVILLFCGIFFTATVTAQSSIFVTLGSDDSGRYYEEDYGVPPEKFKPNYSGTERKYTPGMKVYPNAPNGKYRIFFWDRTEYQKENGLLAFSLRISDKPTERYVRFNLQPGEMGQDYIDLTAEEFQGIIDRFPVYIDQQYM